MSRFERFRGFIASKSPEIPPITTEDVLHTLEKVARPPEDVAIWAQQELNFRRGILSPDIPILELVEETIDGLVRSGQPDNIIGLMHEAVVSIEEVPFDPVQTLEKAIQASEVNVQLLSGEIEGSGLLANPHRIPRALHEQQILIAALEAVQTGEVVFDSTGGVTYLSSTTELSSAAENR